MNKSQIEPKDAMAGRVKRPLEDLVLRLCFLTRVAINLLKTSFLVPFKLSSMLSKFHGYSEYPINSIVSDWRSVEFAAARTAEGVIPSGP